MVSETAQRQQRARPTPQEVATARQRHIVLLWLLVLVVFASVLGGDFVWTDREDLLQGAYRIEAASDWGAALTESRAAFRARTLGGNADPSSGTWQPLTLVVNTLAWSLWGDCAFCFHLLSVLLHGSVVMGVYALGRHLLSQRRHGNRIAAWAAALFAVHPATVATVAWIGGLPFLLAGAFGTWTLVVLTRLPATSKSRRGALRRWLLLLAAFTAAAVLAHESALLLPVLALVIAGFESAERGRHPLLGISQRRWIGIAAVIISALAVLVLRKFALGGMGFSGSYPAEGFFDNAGSALRHLWFLIDSVLWPGEPIISDAWPISNGWQAAEVASFLGLIVLLAGTGVGLYLRHPAALGALWFLLCILPGVGIFPSDHYHAEQTLYVAVWGIALGVAYLLMRAWRPVGRQLMPGSEALVFVPLLLVLSVITALSNTRWWDHVALFQGEVAHDPGYLEGRVELAKAALEQDDPTTALRHLQNAFATLEDGSQTGYWPMRDAYLALGRSHVALGNGPAAVTVLSEALELLPGDAGLLQALAEAHLAADDPAAAETILRQILAAQPNPMAAADLGVALARQQRYVEAFEPLNEAVETGLAEARHRVALARIYIDADRTALAVPHLQAALEERSDPDVQARLAWVHWQLGDQEAARSVLTNAPQAGEPGFSDYLREVRALVEGDAVEPLPDADATPKPGAAQTPSEEDARVDGPE